MNWVQTSRIVQKSVYRKGDRTRYNTQVHFSVLLRNDILMMKAIFYRMPLSMLHAVLAIAFCLSATCQYCIKINNCRMMLSSLQVATCSEDSIILT